jgi:NAD(P)H-dependent FMN reductase
MKITLLSGSSRANALSIRVANLLKNEIEKNYTNIAVQILDIRDFPLSFVEDAWSSHEAIPTIHTDLKTLMFDADAFILISPEYNGSYSPVMKNLLDHFPKFSRKTFGICTYSPGAMGGMRAAMQMQQLICGLFGVPCPQMLLIGGVENKINADGQLIDPTFKRGIDGFLTEFIWLSKAVFDGKNKL